MPPVSIEDETTTILGTIQVVGYAWQNAVYHIKVPILKSEGFGGLFSKIFQGAEP